MQRANVLGAAILLVGGMVNASLSYAQAEVGADLDVFSSYIWRGVSRTNKPVVQPALWLAVPAGNAAITVGGWANVDVGGYDDVADDIAEGGGTNFNLSEFDPYAEVSFPVGKATLTGGVMGYIYPNDDDAPNTFGLVTSDANTVEIYGKLELDAPLSPELSVYYDLDKNRGAYLEGGIGYSLAASENVSVDFGAVAGFSAGQGISDDPDQSSNFDDDGFTHLDVSAGVPFTAGIVSVTPVVHVVLNGDDRTKITSPTDFDSDVKLWGGISLNWSRLLGPESETIDDSQP